MKKGSIISLQQVERAATAVQRELANVGMWHEKSRLIEVDVIWCRLPQVIVPDAVGYYLSESKGILPFLGWKPGHIYIPQWVLLQLFWQQRGSLRAILRHEYGHAVAFRYPSLVRKSSAFTEAFGASHDAPDVPDDSEREAFVSEYATSNPSEDFAETFMVSLANSGQTPATVKHPALKRKFRFVREVMAAVESGRCSW